MIQNDNNRDAEMDAITQSKIKNLKQNTEDILGKADDQNDSHYEILETHGDDDQINIMINTGGAAGLFG